VLVLNENLHTSIEVLLVIVQPEAQLVLGLLPKGDACVDRLRLEVDTKRGQLSYSRVNSYDTHCCDASVQWYTTTCDSYVR